METSASVGEVKAVRWWRNPDVLWSGLGTGVLLAVVAQLYYFVPNGVAEVLKVHKPVIEVGDSRQTDEVAHQQGQGDAAKVGEVVPEEASNAAAAIAAENAGAGNSFAFPIPAGLEVPDHILDAARGMGRWVTHENGSREFVETADVKTFEAGNGWWVVTPNRIGWHDNSPITNAAGQTLYPVGRALVLESMVKAAKADLAEGVKR